MSDKERLHQIRYFFEHKCLPKWFYEDAENLLWSLKDDPYFLYSILADVFKDEGMENPYGPEELKTELYRMTDDLIMVVITMPEPLTSPLCHKEYLFFEFVRSNIDDNDIEGIEPLLFFTVEKPPADEIYPYFCCWFDDGSRQNFGQCSLEEEEHVAACFEVMDKIFGVEDEEVPPPELMS